MLRYCPACNRNVTSQRTQWGAGDLIMVCATAGMWLIPKAVFSRTSCKCPICNTFTQPIATEPGRQLSRRELGIFVLILAALALWWAIGVGLPHGVGFALPALLAVAALGSLGFWMVVSRR